jgi:GTP-binding protein EngB required for normal cell division
MCIVISGKTGAGKSSIVKALTNDESIQISNKSKGCTFTSQKFKYQNGESEIILYDTVGLNETENGTVSNKEASKQLIQLIQNMKNGITLFILVIEKGRITSADLKNYEFFYKCITQTKVPFMIIFNKCDKKSEFRIWHEENMEDILKLGLVAKEYLSLCFGEDDEDFKEIFDERRKESTQILKKALLKYKDPVKVPKIDEEDYFAYLYNYLADWFGWKKLQSSILKKIENLLESIGYSEIEIQDVVNILIN